MFRSNTVSISVFYAYCIYRAVNHICILNGHGEIDENDVGLHENDEVFPVFLIYLNPNSSVWKFAAGEL